MFCPNCRSEYRPGFTTCKSCGGIPLIEALPEIVSLELRDAEDTLPVGFLSGGVERTVEVDGHAVDPLRIFELEAATQHRQVLAEQGIASILVSVEVEFPDHRARFEVRVRSAERDRAERILIETWQKHAESQGLAPSSGVDVETCPACGTHVALDLEECPECGLVVGVGAEREGAEPA